MGVNVKISEFYSDCQNKTAKVEKVESGKYKISFYDVRLGGLLASRLRKCSEDEALIIAEDWVLTEIERKAKKYAKES